MEPISTVRNSVMPKMTQDEIDANSDPIDMMQNFRSSGKVAAKPDDKSGEVYPNTDIPVRYAPDGTMLSPQDALKVMMQEVDDSQNPANMDNDNDSGSEPDDDEDDPETVEANQVDAANRGVGGTTPPQPDRMTAKDQYMNGGKTPIDPTSPRPSDAGIEALMSKVISGQGSPQEKMMLQQIMQAQGRTPGQ